jgi:hypothetical protein
MTTAQQHSCCGMLQESSAAGKLCMLLPLLLLLLHLMRDLRPSIKLCWLADMLLTVVPVVGRAEAEAAGTPALTGRTDLVP